MQEAVNNGKVKAENRLNINTEGIFYNKNGILLGKAIDIKMGKVFVSSIKTRQIIVGNGARFYKVDMEVGKDRAKWEISFYTMDILSSGYTYLKT